MTEPNFTPYQPEDLAEVLEFVGECNRLIKLDNYHPGDIAHWMSSTFRGHNLDRHFGLYRDEEGRLAALNIITKVEAPGFDLILHPKYRGTPLELTLLKITGKEIQDRLAAANITDKKPVTTTTNRDPGRQQFLVEMGYERDAEHLELVNSRSLDEPIPEPVLPPGYIIRSAKGENEVANLVNVHVSAFNSKATENVYLEVMRTPGYNVERELVVVAPDGTFAAFLIYWPDPVSSSFLFEPVGCHKDYVRKGLTKTLMYHTMHLMKAAGIKTAVVLVHGDNEAGRALYTSVGFRPNFEVYAYQPAK